MKKISAINLFKYTCLGCIASGTIVMAITYIINFIPSTNNDQKNNYTSEVTWDGAYHLGVDDNPDFVASPTQQSIAAALHDQFSLAFPNTNDFTVQITNEFNAVVTALPYSKIYSGSTNVTWDVEQKLNLPQSVLLSPFYTQTNTMYENQDVTEQMVFDKLVSEYSNSLNINQLLLTQRNDVTGEFTVQPKANSTVYNASQLTAQINVTQSAVLNYGKTILTSGQDSGSPTFKYRGSDVTATYSVVSAPVAPISFSNNKLMYAANTEYSGGLFVITGSYTINNTTYTASWTIFCQSFQILYKPTPTNVTNTYANTYREVDSFHRVFSIVGFQDIRSDDKQYWYTLKVGTIQNFCGLNFSVDGRYISTDARYVINVNNNMYKNAGSSTKATPHFSSFSFGKPTDSAQYGYTLYLAFLVTDRQLHNLLIDFQTSVPMTDTPAITSGYPGGITWMTNM